MICGSSFSWWNAGFFAYTVGEWLFGPLGENYYMEVVKDIVRRPLNWLLVAMPIALVLEGMHVPPIWIFLTAAVAIIPLAGLMGHATEHLAEKLGAGIGGLLNATFGNAAELIIALIALSKGPQMYPLVKASITGSIIGNILLVLGLAMVCGGAYHRRQRFNATAASMGATLLALAGAGLVIPTIFYYLLDPTHRDNVAHLSEEIAVILALAYALSLFFSLRTHRHLFAEAGEPEDAPAHDTDAEIAAELPVHWSRKASLIVLVVSTIGVAIISELLVGSIEPACEALGMTSVFVGVIVVAVIGNAAEHSTAVLVAMKNKMDLAINIAIGSSIQIALFVAPALVFASLLFGHSQVLDLHFTPLETIALLISIAIVALVAQDGESHWMEGVMLLAVYIILGLAFFNLPEEGTHGAKIPTPVEASVQE
jgi:Ca2+:H+ antiporter